MRCYADGTIVLVGDEVRGIDSYKDHWTELLGGDTGIVTEVDHRDTDEALNVEVRTKNNGHIWMVSTDLMPVRGGKSISFDETEFLSII